MYKTPIISDKEISINKVLLKEHLDVIKITLISSVVTYIVFISFCFLYCKCFQKIKNVAFFGVYVAQYLPVPENSIILQIIISVKRFILKKFWQKLESSVLLKDFDRLKSLIFHKTISKKFYQLVYS